MNARSIALFGVLAFCAAAQAKTVAWYRFEEEPCGTVTTGDTTFTNTIDATKYPAYARVMTATANNKYGPSTLSTDPARMPIYTNAFPRPSRSATPPTAPASSPTAAPSICAIQSNPIPIPLP